MIVIKRAGGITGVLDPSVLGPYTPLEPAPDLVGDGDLDLDPPEAPKTQSAARRKPRLTLTLSGKPGKASDDEYEDDDDWLD